MSYKITGKVYDSETGLGIPNLIVQAFDKDMFKDDNLGKTITNSEGKFEINYTEKDFKGILEGEPDLYIIIKTGDGVNTLYNGEKNIRRRAKRHENFDIGIPKSAFVAQIKDDKQLLKVLFGVAWLDGVLEPGELLYLQQLAHQKGLAENSEIKPLLAGEPVQCQEAYSCLQAYLGTNPSDEDYDELCQLLETLIALDSVLEGIETELLVSIPKRENRQLALRQRLLSAFLDPQFLAKLATPKIPTSDAVQKKGAYSDTPYRVMSQLIDKIEPPEIKEIQKTLNRLFLQENFAPVKEEITADDLPVIGQIPQELSGMFLRISPNPLFPPIGLYHWFDGDGMLHGVNIKNGQASYLNRYVETETLKIEKQQGKAIWPGLLNLPRFDSPYDIMIKNPANTSVIWHSGKLLVLCEAGVPHHVRVPDLETVGAYTFNNQLTCAFTAHPKIDAVTGEMMFFGFSPIAPPYLSYGVVTAEGEITRIVPIELPAPVMMHDFAITENYSIFLDMPLTFKPGQMIKGGIPLAFDATRKSRIGIMLRHGNNSTLRWFEVATCMVYHTVNAYEEGEEIVLLGLRMPSTNLLIPDDSDSGNSSENEIAKMCRWRINLKTGAITEQLLDNQVTEFPRINDQFVGRKMRYIYAGQGAVYASPKPLLDGVKKYDLEKGTTESCFFGRGRFGGECVFVPRPGATVEDDGWVITYIHDTIANQSELLILNAQNITSEPVARVILPQRVPFGFHCAWVSSEQMATQKI
ncbi:carotenoid oxygenase family protein [Umezakia ovalisporum]|uniref:carotenoid oxygenase family protein n=1 Tax=Umezakia ovalisporum TaxID=75695 RepID=UPI0006F0DF8D|nr:carotenoid oxygenase family protein [Umezakia ovalisporum]CEJ42670.1 Retinal pigment epithelial membrane protein (EC 1 .14.99.36) [Umezakia ovalisporum]